MDRFSRSPALALALAAVGVVALVLGAVLEVPVLSAAGAVLLLLLVLIAAWSVLQRHRRLQQELAGVRTSLGDLRSLLISAQESQSAGQRELRGLRKQVAAAAQRASGREGQERADLTGLDLGRAVTDAVAVETVRLQERLHGDLASGVERAGAELDRRLDDAVGRLADEAGAAQALARRHPDIPTVRALEGTGPRPVVLVELLELVRRSGARSVLAVGCGDAVPWLGHEAARATASVLALVPDEGGRDRLALELGLHGLSDTVSVHAAPPGPTGLPHHYLPWHDTTALPETATGFDLVIAVPTSDGPRSQLPLLPLLAPRLAADALIVLAAGPGQQTTQVVASWRSGQDARLLEAWCSSQVTVLRRP